MNRLTKTFLISLLLLLCSFALPAWAHYYYVGKVFTMTNAAEGNEILMFSHHPSQGLIETGSVKTGGDGSGGGLGNQGGLVLSKDHRWLFAVNAGSDSISAFKIRHDGKLKLTTEDGVAAKTGPGSAPIDLALSRNGRYLFALSASNGTIVAYRVIRNSRLSPLPGISGLPSTINGLAAF